MTRVHQISLLLRTIAAVLFLCNSASATTVKKKHKKKTPEFSLPFEAQSGVGFLFGEGVITDSGPMLTLDASITPTVSLRRKFSVALELMADQRATIGFSLPEAVYAGRLDTEWNLNRKIVWKIGGAVNRTIRSGWPDPYQPVVDYADNPTGELYRTDRNSFRYLSGDSALDLELTRRLDLELYIAFRLFDEDDDPAFDPVNDPMHLTPGDQSRYDVGIAITAQSPHRILRSLLDFRTRFVLYQDAFARDAGTGLTHSGQGGDPSNPLQRYLNLRIHDRNSFRLIKDVLKLVWILEYTHNQDVFEDYYTWNGADTSVSLMWDIRPHISLEAGFGAGANFYTEEGYQPGTSHPPLEGDMTVRTDRNLDAHLGGEWAVKKIFRIFVDAKWNGHDTNYPDYVAGVFPAGGSYNIDFDYNNFSFLSGIRVKR